MTEPTTARPAAGGATNALVTEPNTAFFWSGRTGGIGGQDRAAEIAQANGKTLEMRLTEQGIAAPSFDGTGKTIAWWRQASVSFAEGASGDVRVVLGEKVRDDSMWATVEFPSLQRNARVARVIAIDPATLKQTTLFDRTIESVQSHTRSNQEPQHQDADRRAAHAFMNESRESALQQHPLLANAYATLSVIEKQVDSTGLDRDQHAKVLVAMRQTIATNIQRGQYPEIKIRDNEVNPAPSHER